MKKLFATLLAATMVAGTAVSAFAYVDVDLKANASTKDSDYTLDKAVVKIDNGDDVINVPANNTVYGGDKIYYPILVSEDKIKDNGASTATGAYYYATKASEVDGLRVTIDDVRGGKYVKGTSIVRKDLKLTGATTGADAKETFTIDIATAEVPLEAGADKSATVVIKVGAAQSEESTVLDLTSANNASTIAAALAGKKITLAGKDFTISNPSASNLTFTATENGDVVMPTDAVSIAYGSDVPTANAAITQPAITALTQGTEGSVSTPGTAYGKVYCVEVALADYFGTDESELEFDLDLRTRTKEYTSKDNTAPNMSFTLGKDADTLQAGVPHNTTTIVKFRNNELTLKIDKNTASVKLDEAKETDGTKKDVEHIFLEGIDAPVTFDVKASDQDALYLSVNEDSNKKVIVSNPDAKMTFVNFPGKPEFDFTGTAKFTVEDPDINYYFYEIVDNKPVKTAAKYNKEDECFELRTRTLGSYVISDKELEAADTTTDKPTEEKPTDKPTEEKPVNPTTPDKNVPTGAIA